ncbi:GT2 family glycosyltransferase [Homoserinimonas aerilata]|uniref:GT2 family glycosyltransferase n=1 Tax=Homoserinimonas aerilata TaxID=1162970 RepID=A0A542YKK9_9MICO|nr:glycosyltransferase [Homoserinimonas aerilata]TQL48610.1 GT2 family glycosyltransferase [Homoserinimonas aerilata]
MRQRVTAILVARNGGDHLKRTLPALAAQTRAPDTIIAVDAASDDDSEKLLAASGPTQLVSLPPRANLAFGAAVAQAARVLGDTDRADTAGASTNAQTKQAQPEPADPDSEWLWLLAHDSAPHPRALQQLLAAVEIAPSVAIAGPKVMSWDRPDVIAEFGEAVTRFGTSLLMVEDELDQAQHDVTEDMLGVAMNGMLVRRSVWQALGGFDPGLPSVDAGLDFSIRARLAGHRVIVVPGARVSAAGGPEHFGRRSVSAARRARVARAAQLHRRLVYAPLVAVPLHWLSLLPLAVLRAVGQLLAKHPGFVGGEFAAALAAMFDAGVAGSRARLRRSRRLGWGAIAPLRVPAAQVREKRAQAREASLPGGGVPDEPKVGYLGGGGLWAAVFAGVVGVVAFGPLLGAQAVSGGGLLPLSATVGELWSNVGYGWRSIGTGFEGFSDPFAYVLAVLGSITFWSPSFSIVLLYLLALPLASAGAWFAARRISRKGWIPLVAAVLWSAAPPLLSSLMMGHLGASIAHILLPWLVLATVSAARSVPAAAAAGLLFAVVAASAPVLVPALLVMWVVWMVAQPRGLLRIVNIPILAAALFAPLVVEQIMRGTPLALLADPGAPAAAGASSGWHLALLSAAEGLNGWTSVVQGLALPGVSAHVVVAVLLAPVGILALLALFVPGSRRSIPSLVIALLGFVTAVAASRIELSSLGAESVPVWPGSGLSLFWLGLTGGVVVVLGALGRASAAAGLAASLATVVLAVPLLGAMLSGESAVQASSGRIVPAVVAAEARTNPQIGMLRLVPAGEDALVVELQRGTGATLDEQSTLAATAHDTTDAQRQAATLAANLASRGSYDPTSDLAELYIGFIVLADVDAATAMDVGAAEQVHKRAADSLDGNPAVTPVGQTSSGLLWRVTEPPTTAPDAPEDAIDSLQGRVLLGVQALFFVVTVLLAIPTQRRRRVRSTLSGDGPAATFDEESDD